MNKTNEQLLAAFGKANKERRLKIAQKAGFATTAEYVASLKGRKSSKKSAKITVEKPKLDYVVAFDTTGSMDSYIGNVKAHVEKLIPELFSQDVDLMIRIIAFGDYCDMRGGQFVNAYQQSEFTNDQAKLINFVKGAKGTSGGDEDEFYELVIKKIVEETPWRKDAKRSVLFIADCNPHYKGYQYSNSSIISPDWREEAKKAAKLNIAFDTLSIHGDKYPWYKELANITGGVYMPFQSSNKMSEVMGATFYARGGSKKSKETFATMEAMAYASGDSELIGVYKSLSTLEDK